MYVIINHSMGWPNTSRLADLVLLLMNNDSGLLLRPASNDILRDIYFSALYYVIEILYLFYVLGIVSWGYSCALVSILSCNLSRFNIS